MRIFNLDMHCSVITDDQRQLEACGHQVTSVNLTGHNWVMHLPRIPKYGTFSGDVIWDYSPDKMMEEHPELKHYDAFLCTYPPLLIRKFEKFGKPMIVHIPIRYDSWTTDNRERWESWHQWFGDSVRSGKLFVAANSTYDVEYCRYFSGIKPEFIPSMCDYMPHSYTGELDTELLWDSRSDKVHSLFTTEIKSIKQVRNLYGGRYEWKNLPKHRAIVHVPYNASIMGFFEHYAMNIPLFVPTPDFLVALKFSYGALSEVTDRQTRNNFPAGSFGKGTFSAPDPNEYNDPEALLWWTQHYDMYNMPHVIQFESVEDLREKLKTTDLNAVSAAMKESNRIRKIMIVQKWKEFMERVK